MSWSVGATGKAPEVKTQIAQQFENGAKCVEPEENIRQEAAKLIALSLDSQDATKEVQVSAYGSQSTDYGTNEVRNSLNITVTPIN